MKKQYRKIHFLIISGLISLVLILGIGYASVGNIALNIDGEVETEVQDGVFITSVEYVESSGVDTEKSKIINAYQTILDSDIYLSDIEANSSITYQITIYNSNNEDYYFYDTTYMLGDDTYSNQNIIFKLDGLDYNTRIEKYGYITFNITFLYDDVKEVENNNLKSILNFVFLKETYCEIQSVINDYSLTVTCDVGSESQNMTVDNFVLSIDEIVIPEPAYGLMTFTKTYDSSTSSFKIVRTRLTGSGFITYSGKLHMIKNPTLIAEGEGTYIITIDCTNILNYQDMTADDFYYEIDWLDAPDEPYSEDSNLNGVSGTMTFTKTYNPSTGKLTIQRSSITGTGTVKFAVKVYIVK